MVGNCNNGETFQISIVKLNSLVSDLRCLWFGAAHKRAPHEKTDSACSIAFRDKWNNCLFCRNALPILRSRSPVFERRRVVGEIKKVKKTVVIISSVTIFSYRSYIVQIKIQNFQFSIIQFVLIVFADGAPPARINADKSAYEPGVGGVAGGALATPRTLPLECVAGMFEYGAGS